MRPALATAAVILLAACGPGRNQRLIVTGDTPAGALVEGVLHVTSLEAYMEDETRRIRLVHAPPQTARSLEVLLLDTAAALRPLAERRVRARGQLQGEILWNADVALIR